MFSPDDAEHALAKGHLTVVEAAKMAGRAGVRRVVLIHLSPRYSDDDLAGMEHRAQEIFEKAAVGKDLDSYSVAYPED